MSEPKKETLEEIILLINNKNNKEAYLKINKVINNFPMSILSLNILGALKMELCDFEGAILTFKKIISIKSNFSIGFNNLGLAFYKIKDYKNATLNFLKAIEIDKAYIDPNLNLSSLYYDIKEFKKSISHCKKIIKINPNYCDAYFNMGKTYKQIGKIELAIRNFEIAISITPSKKDALKILGSLFLQKGKWNKGIECLEQYIIYYPEDTATYYYICSIKKFKENDCHVTQMLSLENKKLSNEKKMYLYFALEKFFFDIKNFRKSFFYYKKGNIAKGYIEKFDITNEINLNQILQKKFLNKNISFLKNLSFHDSHSKPIFIVGMPRSGTTLIEQVLSRHSKITALGELEILTQEINKLNLINGLLEKEKIILLRKNYFNHIKKNNVKSEYFTDKMPNNYKWIGYITLAFPEAKILHIDRNSKATCWSNFKTCFLNKGNGFSNKLENLVEYYLIYKQLITFWFDNFNSKIYNISYEHFVHDFENQAKNLINYLNLDWEKKSLTFYKSKRYVSTASFAKVKEKIYSNSSEEWKNYESFLEFYFQKLN